MDGGGGAGAAANGKVKCPMPSCGLFVRLVAMPTHLRKVHGAGPGAEQPAVCLLCATVVPNGALHANCGSVGVVRCPMVGCLELCGSPDAVNKHVLAEHSSEISRLRREYQDTASQALDAITQTVAARPIPTGAFYCDKCVPPRLFETNKSRLKHTRTYHNYYKATLGCATCLECRAPTRRALMRRMRERGCVGNRFCPVCNAEVRPVGVLGRGRRGGLSLLVEHIVAEHAGYKAGPKPHDCLVYSLYE